MSSLLSQATPFRSATALDPATLVGIIPPSRIERQTAEALSTTTNAPQSLISPLAITQNGAQRVTIFPTYDQFISPDDLMLGGVSELGGSGLIVRGLPSGPLDTGTLLSVVASDRPLAGTRAGVGPNGVTTLAGYGNFDEVNFFNEATSPPPRFIASSQINGPDGVAHAVSYDATHAYFSPPLPAAQIALLRPQMHVMTNSIDGTVRGPAVINGRLPISTYGGQIQTWSADGSSITVDGWAVPAGGYKTGQVPGTTYDTRRSSYTAAALMVGVYTKTFGRNTVIWLDNTVAPTDSNNPLGQQTTLVREGEGDEIDLWNGFQTDYTAVLHGITIVYSGLGTVPATNGIAAHAVQPTADSYDLELAGAMPNLLELNGASASNFIIGSSILVKGNFGVSGAAGATGELFEHSGYMDGTTNMRLVDWLQKDTATVGGTGGSMHIGLIEAGTQGLVSGGALQSQLVFNPGAVGGSIGLVGYSGGGVTVAGDGDFTIRSSGLTTLASQTVQFGWNCSRGDGEACIQVPGDAGSSKGFEVWQDTSANNPASAMRIFKIDSLGTTTQHGSAYIGGSIYSGSGSSLILRTPASGSGGTIVSDTAGDVTFGTQVAGGRTISTLPVTFASFVYARLPMTGHIGNQVMCSDCLKPGEITGAGTGMMVFDDGHSHWVSFAGTIAAH